MIPWYTHIPMVMLLVYALNLLINKDKLLDEKDKIISELSAPKIKLDADEVMTITITKKQRDEMNEKNKGPFG